MLRMKTQGRSHRVPSSSSSQSPSDDAHVPDTISLSDVSLSADELIEVGYPHPMDIINDNRSRMIDLCNDSPVEIIEVDDSVNPVRLEPGLMQLPDHSGLSAFSFSNPTGGDIDRIFARIQLHLRSQASLLGQYGFLWRDMAERVDPHQILKRLSIGRVSTPTEALSLGSCPICLEAYKPRMMLRILPDCGHSVHKSCMDKWITKSRRYTCPLDNLPISTVGISESSVVVIDDESDAHRSGVNRLSSDSRPLRRSSRLHRRTGSPRSDT